MEVARGRVKAVTPWLMLLALVIFYIAAYAPMGLDNNDGGFMLGLSFQLFKGQNLYSDVLYVRPPLSPWLHEFVFFEPFSVAPVWSDRVFFYVQIAISSLLSSLVAKRLLGWGENQAAAVAAMAFMMSAHAFPPMGWHTVDGIFFSVLSLYTLIFGLNHRYGMLILSAASAMAAAACKQPFYMVPPLILFLAIFLRGGHVAFLILLTSMLFMAALLFVGLRRADMIPSFVQAISSQTNLNDLYQAGVLDYINDISGACLLLVLAPLGCGLFVSAMNVGGRRFQAGALLLASWLILLLMGRHYWRADNWSQPFALFDSVFFVTLVSSLAMAIFRRAPVWFVMVGMHGVAWASSISWGYQTTALYAAPSVIVIGHFLGLVVRDERVTRWLSFGILPLSFLVFLVGHHYVYSLEGPVRIFSNVEDMGRLSPVFKYIKSTPGQRALYHELTNLRKSYPEGAFVVLPNMPLAHLVLDESNPVGVDWALNVEIGKRMDEVLSRLRDKVAYAFVRKNSNPSPQTGGKFGSDVSVHVTRRWIAVGETSEFIVYRNPLLLVDAADTVPYGH